LFPIQKANPPVGSVDVAIPANAMEFGAPLNFRLDRILKEWELLLLFLRVGLKKRRRVNYRIFRFGLGSRIVSG
jgi:hypothetical protein